MLCLGGQEMVWDIPTHVITNVRDLSKNSGNPAFAHSYLCPELCVTYLAELPQQVDESSFAKRIGDTGMKSHSWVLR